VIISAAFDDRCDLASNLQLVEADFT